MCQQQYQVTHLQLNELSSRYPSSSCPVHSVIQLSPWAVHGSTSNSFCLLQFLSLLLFDHRFSLLSAFSAILSVLLFTSIGSSRLVFKSPVACNIIHFSWAYHPRGVPVLHFTGWMSVNNHPWFRFSFICVLTIRLNFSPYEQRIDWIVKVALCTGVMPMCMRLQLEPFPLT